ncbi:uncharacterized protein DSM5745_09587 [Aspergillus mulundensis]|uniref:Uncharacterized protein n=1 Tax=Aspergillus mulundensis TaxID=1810919 RepID=A0A3D8QVW9_9EURO|nr:hypothetical protein DSM5745_09587 [Aspergillus mulundensis]RDW65848.1 hypothetical protein DSM5745_09587 [Aspergillus mulundensis]
MSSTVIQILHETDRKTWSYGSDYVDGALRLFRVDDLLSQDSTIVLLEWRDLDVSQRGDGFPTYAAISHSWSPSVEVQKLSSIANRPLDIDIGQDAPHQIS